MTLSISLRLPQGDHR